MTDAPQTDSPSTGRAILGLSLKVLGAGLWWLGLLHLPGGLIAKHYALPVARDGWLSGLVMVGLLVGVGMVLLFAARFVGDTSRWWQRWPLVLVVTLALWAGLSQLRPAPDLGDRPFDPKTGLVFYPPGQSLEDCKSNGCHTYHYNALGLRGPVPGARSAGTRILMVGDSHIFGIGVGETETVPVRLATHLALPELEVINGGLPGLALPSFPGMVDVLSRDAGYDLVIVLLKSDDVSDWDQSARIRDALGGGLFGRMLYAVNLEQALAFWNIYQHQQDPEAGLARLEPELNRLYGDLTSAGTPLLVIADLRKEQLPFLERWMKAHPDVGWMNVRRMPRWRNAPRIEGDGHWDVAGCDIVAEIIADGARKMLDDPNGPAPVRP